MRWQIEVHGGFPVADDRCEAPMVFGTPHVFAYPVGEEPPERSGDDEGVYVPLCYGPVLLRSADGHDLLMQLANAPFVQGGIGYTSYRDVRILSRPVYEFDWTGVIVASGFEVNQKGEVRTASWRISAWNEESS